jgi:hypothetical protein
MAGGKSSLTVVKHAASRALAPLGVGGDASGDGGDGASKQPSPMAAVWAIVQCYAIVALVLTAYSSVFGDAAHSTKVPDEVQVRPLYLITDAPLASEKGPKKD